MKGMTSLVLHLLLLWSLDSAAHVKHPFEVRTGHISTKDDVKLFFRITQEQGKGIPVIYLHGGPGFDQNDGGYDLGGMPQERTFIFYDQRGGGFSSPVTEAKQLTVDKHVEDLEALRLHFGLKHMHLMAQSWGTGIAVKYSLKYPHRVASMILMAPLPIRKTMFDYRMGHFFALGSPQSWQRFGEIKEEILKADTEAQARRLCEEYMQIILVPYLTGKEKDLTNMQGNYCSGSWENLRNRWGNNEKSFASLGEWDWRIAVAGLRMPVLLFDGDATSVPKNTVREWAHYLPVSRFFFVENAGHLTWLDNPNGVAESVNTFLGPVDAPDFHPTWPENSKVGSPLELDLLAHYTLDGHTANIADTNNQGFAQGEVRYGKIKEKHKRLAAQFERSTTIRVTNPRWTPISKHWSWSVWFRLQEQLETSTFLTQTQTDNASGTSIIWNQGNLEIWSSGEQMTSIEVSKGTWHHLVLTRDGNTFRAYLDQELRAKKQMNADDPAGDFIMGGSKVALSNLRIYARTLSVDDVAMVYMKELLE